MKLRIPSLFLACAAAGLLSACGATPNTGSYQDRQDLHAQAMSTLAEFRRTDPTLQARIDSAYAYAIFPKVVSAAVGVGGAHGNGEVYQNGRLVGYADVSQGNVGIQLGAQKYSELILFENSRPFE